MNIRVGGVDSNMDIFKITMSQEDFSNSDYASLIISLDYLKDKGKIIDFTKCNFFQNVIIYFAVKDMEEVIDQIENLFKMYKVKAFGRKKILGDLKCK